MIEKILEKPIQIQESQINISELHLVCNQSSKVGDFVWCKIVLCHFSNASQEALPGVRKWYSNGGKSPGHCSPYQVGLGTCLSKPQP